ncbi:MAG: hypothetical protein ACXABD_04445 [Candidatus Thorarchaeota archaeon]|jgi:hypothetical protein
MLNFVIYTDSDGKMPIMNKIGVPLSPSVAKHHRYWVEYRNNKPVKVRPYPGADRVWDYSANTYVDINQPAISVIN